MTILANLLQATVDRSIDEIDGETLGRPQLRVTDGANLTWGVDVDIGQTRLDDNGDEVAAPLINVPIASGNQEILYADAGAAVRLRRSRAGRLEVVGFSKRKPGTYTVVDVMLPTLSSEPFAFDVGPGVGIGMSARALSYGEIDAAGGYGTVPYGAIGVFRGGVLEDVR